MSPKVICEGAKPSADKMLHLQPEKKQFLMHILGKD